MVHRTPMPATSFGGSPATAHFLCHQPVFVKPNNLTQFEPLRHGCGCVWTLPVKESIYDHDVIASTKCECQRIWCHLKHLYEVI